MAHGFYNINKFIPDFPDRSTWKLGLMSQYPRCFCGGVIKVVRFAGYFFQLDLIPSHKDGTLRQRIGTDLLTQEEASRLLLGAVVRLCDEAGHSVIAPKRSGQEMVRV